ncbi:YCF48-related protein [Methylibium sp. Root1272]|uniref:WD40/YVTN/BNR-like repeat-containing protein n=1 Tax=Methylibium sp. Root1272 TaxID=1736441 RepID=UPI0006F922D0|nr:YCF48-related protein [Methylibium sp. Root1272]KQW69883.1 photosystem II stability/assembly factor-like protein [Methylibium sp. Root1272]
MAALFTFLTRRAARGAVWLAGMSAVAAVTVADVPSEVTARPDAIQQIYRGTPHDALFDIAFDGPQGVAVGAFGTVLASRDGGASWTRQAIPMGNLALLSTATAAGHCLAVGQTGIVFTAEDCKTWQASAPVTKSRLLAVGVNAQGVAYAVGAFGTVLRSSDWGRTWALQPVDWAGHTPDGAEPHLYDVHVAADGSATVVGEFELILRSDAAGAQWKVPHKGERSLFGLTVLDDKRAYAVGQSGAVLASGDGGASWRTLATGTQAILTGVHVGADGRLTVSGINTLLSSKNEGASWQRVQSKFIGGGWYQALAAAAPSAAGKPRLLAVGSGGSILAIEP